MLVSRRMNKGALFLGTTPEVEYDSSCPSIVGVKNVRSLQSAALNYVHLRDMVLRLKRVFLFVLDSVILSVLDPRKCEYLKDYSLHFEHAYMTTYLAS